MVFVPLFFPCEIIKVREGRLKPMTVSDINQPPTISTLTQHNRQTVSPLQKRSNWGPTAGSTVIASTPEESALPSVRFQSTAPECLIDCRGGISWNIQPGCSFVFCFLYINRIYCIHFFYDIQKHEKRPILTQKCTSLWRQVMQQLRNQCLFMIFSLRKWSKSIFKKSKESKLLQIVPLNCYFQTHHFH